MKRLSLVTVIIFSTLIFCLAIAFDISPYLRGPSYYPPEWRWEYLFVNTLDRIYLPILFIGASVWLFVFAEKKKLLERKPLWLFLLTAVLLLFCLQFSILYFSRSGIGVLIHRIINPEINGYFTAALTVGSVPEFLRNYNWVMLEFVYHAKAHPPGAILLFYYIHQLVALFPALGDWASQQIPNRDDVRVVWNTLSSSAKATVFVSAVIIPLLSSLSVIPLYYTAKMLYGVKAAVRSVFLFLVIPSIMFFIPINDAFLHIFTITAFCLFVYGLQKNALWALFSAGVIMCIGILFNLSILPPLMLFFIFYLLHEREQIQHAPGDVFVKGLFFAIGLFLPFIALFVYFDLNFIQVTQTIMHYVPDIHTRSYTIWIFYNLYDFFVFTGIPVALSYFAAVKTGVKSFIEKKWQTVDPLLVAFTLMLLIVNFSGSIRAETGRIWIPYIPFVVLIVSGFLTKSSKIATKAFVIILLLQALQILVMQEFWVMLW